MGQINYSSFIKALDIRLDNYFKSQAEFICCKKGCAHCCKKGDYPTSELELRYLMEGYAKLDNTIKIEIQNNLKNVKKGGECPFLINDCCSVYQYRPIICRVHGLAYLCTDNTAKVPYCTNFGLNYSKIYSNSILSGDPIKENLDTQNILKELNFGEIRNLYDWLVTD